VTYFKYFFIFNISKSFKKITHHIIKKLSKLNSKNISEQTITEDLVRRQGLRHLSALSPSLPLSIHFRLHSINLFFTLLSWNILIINVFLQSFT